MRSSIARIRRPSSAAAPRQISGNGLTKPGLCGKIEDQEGLHENSVGIYGVLDDLLCCGGGRGLVAGSMNDLNQFLEEAASKQTRCACCANPELAAVIVEFLDRLKAGTTSVSLHYLHQHYLVPRFKTPKYVNSARDHIRRCLRRDLRTGESLDG